MHPTAVPGEPIIAPGQRDAADLTPAGFELLFFLRQLCGEIVIPIATGGNQPRFVCQQRFNSLIQAHGSSLMVGGAGGGVV